MTQGLTLNKRRHNFNEPDLAFWSLSKLELLSNAKDERVERRL